MNTHIINSVTIFLLILATGCTNLPKKIELKQMNKNEVVGFLPCESFGNHVIAADKRGNYIPVTFKAKDKTNNDCNVELKKSSSESSATDAKNHFENIFNIINKSGRKPLIFIHGGLNDYEDGLKRMARDIHLINTDGSFYPIFILWPSGANTYIDSLTSYFQGEWDRPADTLGSPFKVITDVMQIPGRSMANYATNFRLASKSVFYLEKENPFINNSFKFIYSYPYTFPSLNLNYFSIADDPCTLERKPEGINCIDINKEHINEFFYNQQWRRTVFMPLKLATIPMLDPLARRAWDSMNARIRFTFRTPCSSDKSGIGNCEPGVVYQFFKALESKNEYDKKITLIGHSIGSIVVSEIIREFHELPYENVIFGGAAISIREFKNTVEATLRKKVAMLEKYSDLIELRKSFMNELITLESTEKIKEIIVKNEKAISELELLQERDRPFKFYNLSLHPFAEAREESGWGMVPSGSLLEWIDQIIENPADGLDRTLGKWTNIAPLLGKQDYLKKEAIFDRKLLEGGYMSFSRFGLDPSQPLEHTHFGNSDDCKFKYWKPENWKLGNNKQNRQSKKTGNCQVEY